jgi:ParB family chromosome partitioning protein
MLEKRGGSSGVSPKKAKSASRTAEKKTKSGKPRRARGGAKAEGLTAVDVTTGEPPESIAELSTAVRESGGAVIGAYRDPIGGHWQIIASLPIDKVEPTPFQRDVSDSHAARLQDVIGRMGRFLDPIIAVRAPQSGFWTPNGYHRLTAMRKLGARSLLAVVVPDPEVAYQILAMNTEKGHNLREKSLEVMRMARSLAEMEPRPESDYALEFEEPDYVTLGLAYEKRGRLSGGAYHPVLKRVDAFLDTPLPKALEVRAARADKLIALDDLVAAAVAALKEKGFTSPYLKAFVVARLNPLRFRKGATMSADELLDSMSDAARKFDAGKVKIGDLAAAPPGPAEE